MDILGGMSSSEEKPQIYFGFKTMGQQFYANGDTPVEFKYLQLDIDTFKSGWGRYTKADGFEYKWDAKFGVVDPKPADDWKRAFSCWVMPDGGHAMLWQRFTVAEAMAFNKMLGTFWHEKDANVGKLPVMEYKGSKPIQVGMGTSSELTFEFVKWGDRGFNVPDWYVDPDAPVDNDDGFVSPNAGLADLVNQAEEDNSDVPF